MQQRIRRVCVEWYALCQQTSCWIGYVILTSYCDVTNGAHPVTMTTIRHCTNKGSVAYSFNTLAGKLVAHLNHFVFEIKLSTAGKVLNVCQQELLNFPFVNRKTLIFIHSVSLFHPLVPIDFPVLDRNLEKLAIPASVAIALLKTRPAQLTVLEWSHSDFAFHFYSRER